MFTIWVLGENKLKVTNPKKMGPDKLFWGLREVPGRRISVWYSSDRSGGPKLPPKIDLKKKHEFKQIAVKYTQNHKKTKS